MSTPPPSEPALPATVAVTIDGRRIDVPRTMPHPVTGAPAPTTMMQACELAGVRVPHYCYHPKLPVAGNCRMCLVEYGTPALGPDRKPLSNPDGTPKIRKAPNPVIACATPISPGLEIYTQTPGVKAAREAVLEFLLANHPLDCPICDQAGECQLQQYALEYGHAQSRFDEAKVHKPKQVDLGPRIMLDDERCILCSRCIRFTRDIVGDDALGFVRRGSHTALTHYPGRPFDNNYTLNTVDLCPVGALTSKDFRFRMRVWFLGETPSICPSCGTGCNMVIGARENVIYRLTPRSNDAVNQCWMCDAGRLNYSWIGRADRLAEVQVPGPAGSARKSGWKAALEALAARLGAAPRGSVALIASARLANEELFLLARIARALEALTDSIPRTGEGDRLLVHPDRNPNTRGAQLFGIAADPPGARLPAIAGAIREGRILTLLVFGEDVTRHGIGLDELDRLDLLVASDVLPNATTGRAHFLLPGAAFAEKSGTFTSARGRVQRFAPAVQPPGSARAEREFLRELASALTGEAFPDHASGLFDQMAREFAAFRGLTWAGLGAQGVALPANPP